MEQAVAPRAVPSPGVKAANMVDVEAPVSESVGTSGEAGLLEDFDQDRRDLNDTPFG